MSSHHLPRPGLHEIIRYRYQHGTNIGSIFVLEKWLHGSMYDAGTAGSSELDAVVSYESCHPHSCETQTCTHTFAGQSPYAASMTPVRNGKRIGPQHYRMSTCTGYQKVPAVPQSDFPLVILHLDQSSAPTPHSLCNLLKSMLTLGPLSRNWLLDALHTV